MRLLVRRPAVLARKYWWALALLFAGAVADAVTTFTGLRNDGVEAELHFAQRWLADFLGVGIGVPLGKSIQVACVLLVAFWWRRWTTLILVLCGLLYTIAALNNAFAWTVEYPFDRLFQIILGRGDQF